jgi:hypothetical protein
MVGTGCVPDKLFLDLPLKVVELNLHIPIGQVLENHIIL